MPTKTAVTNLALSSLPSANALGRELKQSQWFRNEASALIFVCGANRPGSQREKYLDYANRHLGDFGFFRAEAILEGLEGSDLLTLEDQLADYSDCLMIFCESESAFAELGAFVLKKTLAKKTLVINDKRFQNSKSFINLGPLVKLERESKFGGAIWADPDRLLFSVDLISDRLKRIGVGKRKIIKSSFLNGLNVSGGEKRNRMMLIYDLIRACAPLSRKELIDLLQHVNEDRLPDLAIDLNFLLNLSLVKLVNGYFVPCSHFGGFVYLSHNRFFESLRIDVIRFYRKRDPDRLYNLLNL